MTKPSKSITERIAEHPMYSRSDLKYLRNKGYTDPEILAFWDRDHKMGCKPVQHRPGGISPSRTTVPEKEDPAEPGKELRDLMEDCMSPHAVASIISHLQGARTNNPDVDRQVHWFTDELAKLLGGYEHQAKLAEELGL